MSPKAWQRFYSALLLISLIFSFVSPARISMADDTAPAPGGRVVNPVVRPEVEANLDESGLPRGLLAQDGPVQVMVELNDAPTTQIYAQTLTEAGNAVSASTETLATQLAQAQLAKIEQAQQELLSALPGVNASVLYRIQRVYNGRCQPVDNPGKPPRCQSYTCADS